MLSGSARVFGVTLINHETSETWEFCSKACLRLQLSPETRELLAAAGNRWVKCGGCGGVNTSVEWRECARCRASGVNAAKGLG